MNDNGYSYYVRFYIFLESSALSIGEGYQLRIFILFLLYF